MIVGGFTSKGMTAKMPANLNNPFGPSCCDGGACNEPQSAQPCGCDAGAKWVCERHQLEAVLKASIKANEQHIDSELEKSLFGRPFCPCGREMEFDGGGYVCNKC